MSAPTDVLYPPIEPHAQGWLPLQEGHEIYWEASGAPEGLPVLFLHGGPGSGASPAHRRFFDPARYRILILDQRGCGRSRPRGALAHNTTDHLIADIERLRRHLGISRWLVTGGSWGAALALAYAARHKEACLGLLLRGVFLTGQADLDWFFTGAGALLPADHQQFLALLPRSRRRNPLVWLERALKSGDEDIAQALVARWLSWESALARPGQGLRPLVTPSPEAIPALLDKYRLQAHYLRRQCFLGEKRLLDGAARLHGLPTLLVHGRLDLVCRPQNAWRVSRTLLGSRLIWVNDAGHDPFEGPMANAMVTGTNYFATHGDFADIPQSEPVAPA